MENLTDKAHRELDLIVAKAIGWEITDDRAKSPEGYKYFRRNPEDFSCPPYYSSDMSAAWKAIEVVMQPPTSQSGIIFPPNTRFQYWFHTSAMRIVCASQEDAARDICFSVLECMKPYGAIEVDAKDLDLDTAAVYFVE